MGCPICGPKCSAYYMILSAWGVIMLALMGLFFWVRSPALFEDVSIDMAEWHKNNFTREFIQGKYEDNAVNCWLAAGLYVVVFIFSFIQQRMGSRASYEQS